MSASKPLTSSPSKHNLASRSVAGNLQYRFEDIRSDLECDIDKATPVDFDKISQYFLSRCLVEDEAKNLVAKVSLYEHLHDKRDKTEAAVEELTKRRKDVDTAIEDLYAKALDAVLDIANNDEIRDLLRTYVKSLQQKDEKKRYKPYAALCNRSLELLANIKGLEQLRKPDELGLHYEPLDPKEIASRYQDMEYEVKRKPDVVRTALIAFLAGALARPNWPVVLSNDEFKSFKNTISKEAEQTEGKKYKFMTGRRTRIAHRELKNTYDRDPDVNPEAALPESATISGAAQSSKRRREEEGAVVDEPESKARRTNSNLKGKDKASSQPSQGTTGKKSSGSHKGSAKASSSHQQGSMLPPPPPPKQESSSRKAVSGRVQCGAYALEMMSNNVGVHHVINLLLIDEYLWVWYYDRQGIFRSDGISLVADFPRVLVLLLAFQRFSLADWGVVECMNPDARMQLHRCDPEVEEPAEGPNLRNAAQKTADRMAAARLDAYPAKKVEFQITDKLQNVHCDSDRAFTAIEIDTTEYLSHQPHCIAGRATAVFNAVGKCDKGDVPMVVKISNPEVERSHEGEIMQLVRMLAMEKNEFVDNLPTLYFCADIPGTSTKDIRSILGVDTQGHRVMRMLGQKRLEKLMTVAGDKFLEAWLVAVLAHSFVWQSGVEHGDPSLSNVMYDAEKECAVLTDFDLAILRRRTQVPGSDRTGTIPFMALDLLTKEYWDGGLKREHFHELEAFIWILPYVFLLYQDGQRCTKTPIDSWITSDYNKCYLHKLGFLNRLKRHKRAVQPSWTHQWDLAHSLLSGLRVELNERITRHDPEEEVDASADAIPMWKFFVEVLEKHAETYHLSPWVTKLKEMGQPFDELTPEQEMKVLTLLDEIRKKHGVGVLP